MSSERRVYGNRYYLVTHCIMGRAATGETTELVNGRVLQHWQREPLHRRGVRRVAEYRGNVWWTYGIGHTTERVSATSRVTRKAL